MLDSFIQQRIIELVAMARHDSAGTMNLRVAWAKFGLVLGEDRWSPEIARDLAAINTAFETYIGKTELAKTGRGAPPIEQELDALLEKICSLERLLPGDDRIRPEVVPRS